MQEQVALRCRHPDCSDSELAFETKALLASHTLEAHTVSFTATCNLGQCSLPMMPEPDSFEQMQTKWKHLEEKFSNMNSSSDVEFVLHDGPPYANGHLHLGHVLNKVLKDAVCKWQRLSGRRCVLRPGWDCHGLPVELAVCKNLGVDAGAKLAPQDLRRRCHDYAAKWVDVQAKELQALGVLAAYDKRYLTMDPEYEAATLRAFGEFVEGGLVHRMMKTVPWCTQCQTSLATAEMEYESKTSPAVLVSFPLVGSGADMLSLNLVGGRNLCLCVYTTTPWTLPLNRAVAVRPDLYYVLVDMGSSCLLVVAEPREEDVRRQLSLPLCSSSYPRVSAESLATCEAVHPWESYRRVPVVMDFLVKSDKGTGCVHLAPGCGPEDYVAGMAHGLEVYCPLSPEGHYTTEAPSGLHGMLASETHALVAQALVNSGRLLDWKEVTHDYPHCWRCHSPLLFRATQQYFCDLATGLANAAAKETDQVDFYPSNAAKMSAAKLRRYVYGRSDWCLSRRRAWGVPVPACLCGKCGHVELSKEVAEVAACHVADVGVVGWGQASPSQLLGRGCCQCGDPEALTWETDVLDVWFDSGVSHAAVLGNFKADLYLEGDDQYRGWFQASLLAAMVLRGDSPTRAFATHSFVVDEDGMKMSKSKGNVVAPFDLHHHYPSVLTWPNPDVLRLWALSADYTTNVKMSEEVVKSAAVQYKKFRKTFCFLLQNLADFTLDDAVPLLSLSLVDKLVLQALDQTFTKVRNAFANFDTARACEALDLFCREQLSRRYFEGSKVTLYFSHTDSKQRRSCQTALWWVLRGLLSALAPLTSYLCEEVWEHMPLKLRWADAPSVHLLRFPDTGSLQYLLTHVPELSQAGAVLEHLRSEVVAAVDQALKCGVLENTSQAQVTLSVTSFNDNVLVKLSGSALSRTLCEYLSLSECVVVASDSDEQGCEVCCVCDGSGQLLRDVCPLCDGDPSFANMRAGGRLLRLTGGMQSEEGRVDPMVDGSAVTQHNTCRGLADQQLSEPQLQGYWNNLRGVHFSVKKVQRSNQRKCPRCWRYVVTPGKNADEDLAKAVSGGLCMDCEQVVSPHTFAMLANQKCQACGRHGHCEAKCAMKRKGKNTKFFAGA